MSKQVAVDMTRAMVKEICGKMLAQNHKKKTEGVYITVYYQTKLNLRKQIDLISMKYFLMATPLSGDNKYDK